MTTKSAFILKNAFSPLDLVNLTWALATLGMEPGADLAGAISRAVATAGGGTDP